MAGIIPLAGWRSSLDFPWPDYMQPIREGFLAFERSVYECAYAGCDSIWIVCNDDVAPLVKLRVGDYVMSPRFFEEKDFVKRKDYHEKWIPVYYVPIRQKDRNKRDSLSWSILHGSLTAYVISNQMSKWVRPTKYYVSFPYGIYNPSIVAKNRAAIRGDSSFYIAHNQLTIKDEKYLGFTFSPEDWAKAKKNIKEQCTGGNRNLHISERWSGNKVPLSATFNFNKSCNVETLCEVEEYYDIENWENLKNYYSSDIKIPRPSKQFMKPYFLKKG